MPDHHGHACHARRLVKVQTNKSEEQLCPMTREQIEREIEDLEAYLRFKQDGIDQLNAKYSGVRPAWVSGDIGWDMMHMDNARSKIKELKEQMETAQ
jgi:predicted RNase H-like nuclease (RuvC/YqgF family)